MTSYAHIPNSGQIIGCGTVQIVNYVGFFRMENDGNFKQMVHIKPSSGTYNVECNGVSYDENMQASTILISTNEA